MPNIDRDKLLDLHEELTNEARDLMTRKNHDYTDGSEGGDPFKNFNLAEHAGLCDAETGITVRLLDKVSRIITYIDGNELKVEDEGFHDTILDLINYAVLLYGRNLERKDNLNSGDSVSKSFGDGDK